MEKQIQYEVQLTDTLFLPILTECLLIPKCLLISKIYKVGFFVQKSPKIIEFVVNRTLFSM